MFYKSCILGLFLSCFNQTIFAGDWLMFGAYDFKPLEHTTKHKKGDHGGVTRSASSSTKILVSKINIPTGKTLGNFYCQLHNEGSRSNFIDVSTVRIKSGQNEHTLVENIHSVRASNRTGHFKISDTSPVTFQNRHVIQNHESCSGSDNTCDFYSYAIKVSFDNTGNDDFEIKSCALYYF